MTLANPTLSFISSGFTSSEIGDGPACNSHGRQAFFGCTNFAMEFDDYKQEINRHTLAAEQPTLLKRKGRDWAYGDLQDAAKKAKEGQRLWLCQS